MDYYLILSPSKPFREFIYNLYAQNEIGNTVNIMEDYSLALRTIWDNLKPPVWKPLNLDG